MRVIYPPPKETESFTSDELDAKLQTLLTYQVPVTALPVPSEPIPPVVITASSTYVGDPVRYAPSKAFDGRDDTHWANNFIVPSVASPAILTIDYTKPSFFEGYRLTRVGNPGQGPVSWDIETSEDGVNWILRDEARNIPLTGFAITEYWNRPFKPERFIRIKVYDIGVTVQGGNNYVGIIEFAAVFRPDTRIDPATNTFTVTKVAHGFPVPSAVAWNGTDWVAANRNGAVDIFIVVAATADTFTYACGGRHTVNHGLGANPAVVYLGSPPGNLTTTKPASAEIILAQVLDSWNLWVHPEPRLFNEFVNIP